MPKKMLEREHALGAQEQGQQSHLGEEEEEEEDEGALRFLRLLYTARSSASGLAGSFNPSSAPRLRPRLM